MHIDVPLDTDKGLTTLGDLSCSKIVPVANISLTEFSTNLELFIADLLLLNLAVSGISKNGSLYPSCIIFETVSFALIIFFQKLWFCFNFPLTDVFFLICKLKFHTHKVFETIN